MYLIMHQMKYVMERIFSYKGWKVIHEKKTQTLLSKIHYIYNLAGIVTEWAVVVNAAYLIKLGYPKYVISIQILSLRYAFEPADSFCSKLITVEKWIQEPHNI